MCCSMLQHVAACCSVSQRVTVLPNVLMCCSMLPCVVVFCRVLQCVAASIHHVLQYAAVGCRVLQRVAVCFSIYILQLCHYPSIMRLCRSMCVCVLQRVAAIKQSILNPCQVAIVEKMQMSPYTATYCNTLQHTATIQMSSIHRERND